MPFVLEWHTPTFWRSSSKTLFRRGDCFVTVRHYTNLKTWSLFSTIFPVLVRFTRRLVPDVQYLWHDCTDSHGGRWSPVAMPRNNKTVYQLNHMQGLDRRKQSTSKDRYITMERTYVSGNGLILPSILLACWCHWAANPWKFCLETSSFCLTVTV